MLDKAAAKSAAALFVCKNYGVIEKGRISGREMRKWHISLSNIPDGGLLQGERIYILNTDFMSLRDAIVTFEFYSSCGFHVLILTWWLREHHCIDLGLLVSTGRPYQS